MSDLQPRLHDVLLDDPSVTRVVHRRAHGTAPRLLTRATGIATSVSVVVPTGGSSGQPFVDGVSAWNTAGLRTEVLVVESADDPGRAVLRDRLSRSGLSWRVLERPAGGRVATLAAVAEAVEQEFLVIPTSGDAPFEQVDPALCHMWTDGCDAAMLELRPTGEVDGDPSAQLAAWLGLHGAAEPGRIVVLRRWVARWLFNEITLAIDAGEEVADRARLLGMGIVRLDHERPPTRA